ncbi:hypothetical protein ABTB22_19795, partial [Acinetobacter baumannii]
KESAEISRADYLEYFSGAEVAYAIRIDPTKTVRFDRHLKPSEVEENFVVPQSFRYVGAGFMESLLVQSN